MEIDLDQRLARLSVGELSDFTLGPQESEGGSSGLWRAQLGTRWHQDLRRQAETEKPGARFEVSLLGELFHRGWRIALQGRIDQWWPGETPVLREIKTVSTALPAEEDSLRIAHPAYFAQLCAYQRLLEQDAQARGDLAPEGRTRAELVFVDIGSGLLQTVALQHRDQADFDARLERLVAFLEHRWHARERLRGMVVQAPFSEWRPAQEEGARTLETAWRRQPVVCFEAPTGFGKTGVLLQAALRRLQAGDAERLIYLSAKGTGQWQVMATLRTMTGAGSDSLAAWQMRPKAEHCIHTEYRCHPDACPHLRDLERRWNSAGLSRFYTIPGHPRTLDDLRAAGLNASICPYEITRSALPFCEVWVGDMNYVFAPSIQGLFLSQPGFSPERTLLVIDEAHHLPARAADAVSHVLRHEAALDVLSVLQRTRAPQRLVQAWDSWTFALRDLRACDSLSLGQEDDLRDALRLLAKEISDVPVDPAAFPTELIDAYWQPLRVQQDLVDHPDLPRLWTSPCGRSLSLLCLDASSLIGPLLRSYAGAVLASATFGPEDAFAKSCGLESPESQPTTKRAAPEARLGKLTLRETRKLFKGLQSGADLLETSEASDRLRPAWVRAEAPWRAQTYSVAIDVRVDTRFQHRDAGLPVTAATVAKLVRAAPEVGRCVTVFFSSFAYAESIRSLLATDEPNLRIALQPRAQEKTGTAEWIERSLASSDALFLVLGSSLAESIDALGGRIGIAMVVGPALPEVNAVQKAKLALHASLGREEAFRKVYQIPGMQRVNQALGRLVRAPGQQTRVLLQCQRFGEPEYQNLLGGEYRTAPRLIAQEGDLEAWLNGPARA